MIHFGEDIAYEAIDSQIGMFDEPEQPQQGAKSGFWALFSGSVIAAAVLAIWGPL